MMLSRTDKSAVATWWWTIDRWFLAAFLSLMILGIVLSFAASPAVSGSRSPRAAGWSRSLIPSPTAVAARFS